MNVVEVKDLTRNFKSHKGIFRRKKVITEALKGINFEIKKGEIFGLLGPNGAGKTTTIKILTTLLLPSSGEGYVLGFNVDSEETKIRKKINFIFGGERSLYWRLSARDNLRYFSDLHKIKKSVQEKRIENLLKLVNLSDRADEKVETYSKGMKQRLQIARGLINDPEILFLDEPTIGLDPVAAKDLRALLLKLKNEGKTILITTHYMQEADDLCDRIAFINNGEILRIGSPDDIKSSIDDMKKLTFNLIEVSVEQQELVKSMFKNINVTKKDYITNVCIETKNIFPIMNKFAEIFKEEQIVNMNTRQLTLEDAYIKTLGDVNG
ncbi:ABC transporter ATP-binding protein [Mycoplasmatota bacterium]|nr:ABC transporter ATP-binding protein [Mycoplasmatota bacterium]